MVQAQRTSVGHVERHLLIGQSVVSNVHPEWIQAKTEWRAYAEELIHREDGSRRHTHTQRLDRPISEWCSKMASDCMYGIVFSWGQAKSQREFQLNPSMNQAAPAVQKGWQRRRLQLFFSLRCSYTRFWARLA